MGKSDILSLAGIVDLSVATWWAASKRLLSLTRRPGFFMAFLNGNATSVVGKIDGNVLVSRARARWRRSRSGGTWSIRVKWDTDWMQQPSRRSIM
jgi:hypothetical protein